MDAFLYVRHFPIIKNICQLNVHHAFQASYHRTLNLTLVQVAKYPENLTLIYHLDIEMNSSKCITFLLLSLLHCAARCSHMTNRCIVPGERPCE